MKVSIAIITYNHEGFIAKAIESILMQRTNFDYEIVIGEDCSLDNTRNIVIDYQKRYPEKIRLLLNEKNLGMHRNSVQTHKACTGQYMALLEGDDYWTSPEKLQKQVDFLDSHPECSICFHDALIVHEDGSKEPTRYRPTQKEFSTVDDLLLDNFIPTSSVMFRRGLFGEIPHWISTLKMGDWPMHILNAHHGKIGYIDESMAVYVVHPGGVWSTKDLRELLPYIIELFEALAEHLGPKYKRSINRILRWRYFAVSELFQNKGDLTRARTYAYKAVAKHLLIISEPLRFANRINAEAVDLLPNYIKSINSPNLLKNMLRLYLVPSLKMYVPSIYKSLRYIAQKLG